MARSAGDARAAGPWREPRWQGRSSRDAARTRARPRAAGASGSGARRRHPRPHQRQLGGDPLSARLLEELDEPFQQPAVLRHLEPEPTADAQIVSERVAKRAHATPPSGDGHGRASARSALRSTLAYIAVVFCSRWRSTWPISAQRRALPEHLGRGRVPQPMRPDRLKPRPPAMLADDRTDRASVQPLERRVHPQEQRPALAPRTAAKIGHDRLADINRQRQHVMAATLA